MVSTLERSIREHVAQYVTEAISLTDLHHWIVPALWQSLDAADPAARTVAAEVDARLIEYDNGDWTEGEIRGLLGPISLLPAKDNETTAAAAIEPTIRTEIVMSEEHDALPFSFEALRSMLPMRQMQRFELLRASA